MNKNICALLGIAVLALSDAASAGPITYQVDRTLNADSVPLATVIGSITTDGHIGALAQSDIVSWTLTLTDLVAAGGVGSDTISSTGALQSAVGGAELLASATQITFDFDATDASGVVFQGADANGWCFTDHGASCIGDVQGELIGFITTGDFYENTQLGTQVIASVVPVPEPGTLSLMGLGLAGVGLLRRKRKS